VTHISYANHNDVLILGTKRCGGTDRINVTANIHVKVSIKNHAMCNDVIEKI
jgi:hypothetical protein